MPGKNPYLFPRCTTTNSHLRGSDVMRLDVATTAQLRGLKEHEMDMLANFLGHDIRIHTEFYRMPLDVLQIARVSKVFLAAERGHISRYAGKGLSEINTEDTEEVELEDDDDIDEDDVEDCSSQPDVASALGKEITIGTLPQTCYNRSNETIPKHDKNKHKKCCPKPWTSHEKEAIRLHFASAIIRLPGKNMIEKFLEETGINRSWKNVKEHSRNTHLS